MGPRYLKPGQDFDFAEGCFTGSRMGRHDPKPHPDHSSEYTDGLAKGGKTKRHFQTGGAIPGAVIPGGPAANAGLPGGPVAKANIPGAVGARGLPGARAPMPSPAAIPGNSGGVPAGTAANAALGAFRLGQMTGARGPRQPQRQPMPQQRPRRQMAVPGTPPTPGMKKGGKVKGHRFQAGGAVPQAMPPQGGPPMGMPQGPRMGPPPGQMPPGGGQGGWPGGGPRMQGGQPPQGQGQGWPRWSPQGAQGPGMQGGPMPPRGQPGQMSPQAAQQFAQAAGLPAAKKGGHFIQKAIKHPGRMKNAAKRAGVSTHEYMEEHAHDKDSLGNAARLGIRLSAMSRKKG